MRQQSIRLPEDLRKRLRVLVAERDTSIQAFAVAAIREKLSREKEGVNVGEFMTEYTDGRGEKHEAI